MSEGEMAALTSQSMDGQPSEKSETVRSSNPKKKKTRMRVYFYFLLGLLSDLRQLSMTDAAHSS
jgi:hypothetical protein